MTAIVYLATNRVNGKRYVGATSKGLSARRRQHEKALNAKRTTCRYFHAAIRKYGPESFDWIVLAECTGFDDALRQEVRLISEIRPEYNLTRGGQGVSGRKMTPEQLEHHSRIRLGKKPSPDAIAKIVAKNTGRKRTAEQRERMGAARRGKSFSEEHRRNLSIALSGKKQPPEVIEKRRLKQLGRRPTAEHREKIRVALIGRKLPPEVVARCKEGHRKRFPETAAKPWLAMGISVATWRRRRKVAQQEVTHVVSLAS
jgi:group I intron endonuclease